MLRNFCFLLLLKKTILTLGEDKDDLNKDIEKIFIERRVIPDVLSEPPESKISETFVYPKNCDPKKFAEHCQVVLSIKQIKNGYLQFIAKLRKDEKWADLAFNANNEKPFWDTFRLKSNGDIIDGYIPHL